MYAQPNAKNYCRIGFSLNSKNQELFSSIPLLVRHFDIAGKPGIDWFTWLLTGGRVLWFRFHVEEAIEVNLLCIVINFPTPEF